MSAPNQPIATPATGQDPSSQAPDSEHPDLTVEEGTALFAATEHRHTNTYRELAK